MLYAGVKIPHRMIARVGQWDDKYHETYTWYIYHYHLMIINLPIK